MVVESILLNQLLRIDSASIAVGQATAVGDISRLYAGQCSSAGGIAVRAYKAERGGRFKARRARSRELPAVETC